MRSHLFSNRRPDGEAYHNHVKFIWQVHHKGETLARGVVWETKAEHAAREVKQVAVREDIPRPFQIEISQTFDVTDQVTVEMKEST